MRNFSVGVIQYGETFNEVFQHINVGMMLRTSVLFGIKNFYIIGSFGFDKKYAYGKGLINSLNAGDIVINNVACLSYYNIIDRLKYLSQFYKIVFCTPNKVELQNFNFKIEYDKPPLFLFGTENGGIDNSIMTDKNFEVITLPQFANLSGYNSSSAMSMICFKYLEFGW